MADTCQRRPWTADISGPNRRDEVGRMARAMLVFQRNAQSSANCEPRPSRFAPSGSPPGGDRSPYPGFRHLRVRRDGRPAPLRRRDARACQRHVRGDGSHPGAGAADLGGGGHLRARPDHGGRRHRTHVGSTGQISHQVARATAAVRVTGQPGRHDRHQGRRARPSCRPDRRRGEDDHRDRRADQSAGTERDDRGGACRRRGKGFAVVAAR